MSAGQVSIVLLIVVPLSAAILAILARRLAAHIAMLSSVITMAAAIALLRAVAERSLILGVGGWGAPLGIDLSASSMTGVLIIASSIIVLCIVLYAPAYLQQTGIHFSFWPLLLFLQAALNGVYLSNDIFNLYVALELMSLSAVGLIALAERPPALDAALRYLLASLVASLAYLLGVGLLYHTQGSLDLTILSVGENKGAAPAAALGLMTAGLAIKGALFPVHFWLPRAHAEAPSPVSALLSGLVVKAPFFVLLRLWLGPFADAPPALGTLLGLLGSAAIIWGSLQALRQERLKLLIAYSTVAQIGYLFLFFPLARADTSLGAILTIIVGHAFAKVAMFLAAGNIIACLGHDRIEALDRVAGRLPLSLATFGIAGICVVGLPPSGNFIAKWLLASAAFNSGAWGWAIVIIAGSLMAAAYVFRVIGHAFTPEYGTDNGAPIPPLMSWAPFVLALLALLLGLFAAPFLALVDVPVAAASGPAGTSP